MRHVHISEAVGLAHPEKRDVDSAAAVEIELFDRGNNCLRIAGSTEESVVKHAAVMDALLHTHPQVVGLALFGNDSEDTARNAKSKIQRRAVAQFQRGSPRDDPPLQFVWDCDGCLRQVNSSGAANAGIVPQPIELLLSGILNDGIDQDSGHSHEARMQSSGL